MKKLMAIVLALVSVFALSGCGSKSNTESQSLYAQGLEVIQLMSEMTRTGEYIDIYTGDSTIKNIIQNIGVGEYSVPKSVYAISIPDENLAAMVELSELDNSSKDLKTFLIQKVLGSLMIQINGMAGAENLAASSVCTVGKTFVDENATGDVIYLYTYENALPVAVTFTIGENHAVSATGVFIMYDGFTCGSADEIKSFFSDIFVKVSEVLPEK